MERLNVIRGILDRDNSVNKCLCCNSEWVPFGPRYEDECPRCGASLGLDAEMNDILNEVE